MRPIRSALAFLPACLALVAVACTDPGEPPAAAFVAAPRGLAAAPTLRAGATAATVTVDAMGQASVRVPLPLLGAGNGLVPALALAYHSGTEAFGPLGYGWGLTPVSSIRRCPPSRHVDGHDAGLAFDDGDRACLDGQRLVVVAGAYFADGSSYRLERDDATLVRLARPGGASDPGSWTVFRRSGEILYFGSAAESRHMHAGGQAIEWKVAELRDRSDNVVRFAYEHDPGERDVRLAAISYGGNAAAGVEPYRRVALTWAAATSPTSVYLAGHELVRAARLERVDVIGEATVVSSLHLGYDVLASGAGELLTSVQECFADRSCYPATRFEYTSGGLALDSDRKVGTTYRPADADLRTLTLRRLVDVDGDGWDDVVTFNRAEIVVERGDGEGHFALPVVRAAGLPRTWSPQHNPALFYDLDADGHVDLLTSVTRTFTGRVSAEQTGLHVLWGTGDGFAPAEQVSRELGAGTEAHRLYLTMADADRDGRPELFAFTDAGLRLFTLRDRRLEPATAEPVALPHFGLDQGWRFDRHPREIADVNGDGFPDVVGFADSAVQVSLGRGFDFAAPTAWTAEFTAAGSGLRYGVENHLRMLADANGDGLPDLVGFHQAGIHVGLNTGRGFAPAALWLDDLTVTQGWTSASQLRAATDMNGDGWLDFVGISPSKVRVVLGRGGPLGPVAELPAERRVQVATSSPGVRTWQRSLYQLDLADLDSDGLSDLACFLPTGLWALANQSQRLRLTAVEDGHGRRQEIAYRVGRTPDVYQRTRPHQYPLAILPSTGPLVTALTERAGRDAPGHTLTYRYLDGALDRTGLGFLGFETWITTDDAAATEHVVRFSLDSASGQAGLPILDEVARIGASGRTALTRAETTWETRTLAGGPGHRFSFPRRTVTRSFAEDGGVVATTVAEQEYDHRQDLVATTTTVTDAFGSQTTTSRHELDGGDPATGQAARVIAATVTSSRPGWPDVVHRSTFAYDRAGRLVREVREPGTPHEERIGYDHTGNPFGRVGTTTRELTPEGAAGLPGARTVTTTTYDARGYLRGHVDVLGHETRIVERDPVTGLVGASRDAAGRVTHFRHDVDGALVETVLPDGVRERLVRARCAADCPAGAVLRVTREHDGAAPEIVYQDAGGRELRREGRALGGRVVQRERVWAFDGQLVRESGDHEPAAAPADVAWTRYEYDRLRRLVRVVRPDGSVEQLERAGTTTTTTDARGIRTTQIVDGLGLLREVIDAEGGRLRYEYDAANRLAAVIAPDGRRTELEYDQLGRRTRLDDPTLGTSRSRHNALGLEVERVDAAGQVTRLDYDLAGRLVASRENADSPDEDVTRWTYDTAANGIGQLAAVENRAVRRSFAYDELGRATGTDVELDGRRYHFGQAYDGFGRPSVHTYPSGLAIENVYDADGFLTEVRDATSGRRYYTVEDTYPWGAPRRVRHGNGLVTTLDVDPASELLRATRTARRDGTDVVRQRYVHDPVGNLTARADELAGVDESFEYDRLDRLVRATRTGAPPVTVAYDALGNIVERSDVGVYRYGEPCDGVSPGPFAVTSAGGRSYCYDRLGRMIGGGGRDLRYRANGLPTHIAGPDGSVTLDYGPSGERVLQVEATSGGTVVVRTPLAGFEDVSGPDGDHTRASVAAGVVVVESAAGVREEYAHGDVLGSVIAVTDAAGAVTERSSYDPWGQRTVAGTGPAPATRVGYTGHPHLASVGLVHMGGRVYDAAIGRFVSPDPVVQDPADTQSLNRYSYVRNNPLSATDPSGFISMKSIGRSIGRALGGLGKGLSSPGRALAGAGSRLARWTSNPQNQRMVAAIAISVAAAYYANVAFNYYSQAWAQWAAGAAVSGAGGFASGYVASDGNLAFARRSALTAMAFFAIGQHYGPGQLTAQQMVTKTVAHGVVGGVSSAASGGSFESGFFSSVAAEGVSLAASDGSNALAGRFGLTGTSPGAAAYTAVAAAVVGGATGELTGGRFEDAALTSALGALFNGFTHRDIVRPDGTVLREHTFTDEYGDGSELRWYEDVTEAGLDGDLLPFIKDHTVGELAMGVVLGPRAPRASVATPRGRAPAPTVDPATGHPVGRIIVTPKGQAMNEPVGGSTFGDRTGTWVETRYPNQSPAQQLHGPHRSFPAPHGHGFLPGPGLNQRGPSLTPTGKQVPYDAPAAHWLLGP